MKYGKNVTLSEFCQKMFFERKLLKHPRGKKNSGAGANDKS